MTTTLTNPRSHMYHLLPTSSDTNPEQPLATEPFGKPSPNATLYYHKQRPMVEYSACLVQVHELTETHIRVHGVNRERELPDTTKLHTFDLRDHAHVWLAPPSSNWIHLRLAEKVDYMVLLIEHTIVEAEPTLKAAQADDGGKWPRGSSTKILELTEEVRTIRERLRILQTLLDEKGRAQLEAIFSDQLLAGGMV